MKSSLSGMLSVFATLSLFGCASFPETLEARHVESNDVLTLARDEILIFGRILFTENGKSMAPYGFAKPMWQLMTPEIVQTPGKPAEKRKILPLLGTERDGVFRYVIPAGRYAITHVQPLGYTPMIDPAVEFAAREAGQAYYLGDLEVDIDAWSWLGGLWGNYITRIRRVEVVDRFDEVRDLLLQNASESIPAKKALLAPITGSLPDLREQYVPPIIHK